MKQVLVLRPDGDFYKVDNFPFNYADKGSYLYTIAFKNWYQWTDFGTGNSDWLPVNDSDVPDNYKSRLQLILLLS